MTHVEIEQRIEAAAELVWDCYLGSRSEELAIGVYAESIVIEGSGAGSVRVSQLLGGAGVIRERIDVLDDKNMVCHYSVIERGPLPYGDYRGQINVTPQGPDACILKLQADFTPIGMTEEESTELYMQNNLQGIARMKTLIGIPE